MLNELLIYLYRG
jgi:hypothetical protein